MRGVLPHEYGMWMIMGVEDAMCSVFYGAAAIAFGDTRRFAPISAVPQYGAIGRSLFACKYASGFVFLVTFRNIT